MHWLSKLVEFWYNETKPPFLTKEQIVRREVSLLKTEDIQFLQQIEQNKLASLHFSWGMYIRNEYSLWDPQNPITKKWSSGQEVIIDQDVDVSPLHPDQVSYSIMEDVWRIVNHATT